MNSEHNLQLEDAQKKLSLFRKHLDMLVQGVWESNNVSPEEVLAAVTELESLIEWATQQSELQIESGLLLDKLQQLHNIRQNLQTPSIESKQPCTTDSTYTEGDKIKSHSEELSGSEVILCNNIDEKQQNTDLLCLSTILTENQTDISEQHTAVDINEQLTTSEININEQLTVVDINICEQPTEVNINEPTSDINISEQSTIIDKSEQPITIDNSEQPITTGSCEQSTSVEISEQPTNVSELSKETEVNIDMKVINNIIGDLNVDLNIKEHNQKTSSLWPDEIEVPSPKASEANFFNPLKNEIIILETNENNKTSEVASDPKCSTDPLDVSMYAIKNLYESLRAKENELLKLSVMRNDQKQIEALQEVIIEFHKDVTNLNSQLEQSKKENALLKEQVLELEEAENDARLAAQNFEQKLVFLQEKDSHSQSELYQLKQSLKKSAEILGQKEASEKEIRSQLKYMETLVQKYEDQIRAMELKQKQESEIRSKQQKRSYHERGTQTYDPLSKERTKFLETENGKNNATSDLTGSEDQCVDNPHTVNFECQTVTGESKNSHVSENESSLKTLHSEDPTNRASLSQNELLKRLHKLMDDDAELQQQIHNVDQINLAMWMKLQSLENDIGKCKRQNINETNSKTEKQLSVSPFEEFQNMPDHTIPSENSDSQDQTEHSIEERLVKLEEINAAFEKDLINRDKLCEDKEQRSKEWKETEEIFKTELKRLAKERDTLMDQVTNLKKEKEELQQRVLQQQTELNSLKERNQVELNKIREEQEIMTVQLHQKVKQLLTKEKEHLKMITNLKSERNSIQDKTELERLKCSYIELQLELSQSRDEIKKLEDDFKVRLAECIKMHAAEETRLMSELENLRKENIHCDKMINELQLKQGDLLNTLQNQEKNLELARENYTNNLQNTNEEHRSVESGLICQLREIEKGTVIATAALAEERLRVEKELEENINDLRIKEKNYKMKIAELESNVQQLRQELSKIAGESELTVEENASSQVSDKNTSSESPNHLSLVSELNKSDVVTSASSQLPSNTPLITAKSTPTEIPDKRSEVAEEMDKTAESVDQLRAQVRQLQNQLERISDSDFVEVPSTKSVSSINTFSMGIPKEDLDYAEIEECTSVRREKYSNPEETKITPTNLQRISASQSPSSYRNEVPNENSLVVQENEENDYDEILPRPTNFHIVQQVGSDTLLVGWNYVNPSVLDGFEVYLDNEVHERIYIPDRTKALISGLDLRKPIRLSIYALSRYGQMSEPAVLELTPHQKSTRYFEDNEEGEYKNDLQNAMTQQQRPYSMEW